MGAPNIISKIWVALVVKGMWIEWRIEQLEAVSSSFSAHAVHG